MTASRPVVEDRLPDALRLPAFREIEPRGLFGERLRLCRENLLLARDEEALLSGFLRRPGTHPWIGEHAGKWLDAACGEFERATDERLAAKIERVASALRSAQEEDGYLGTHLPGERFTGWDVWVHKYVLIGLLSHHRAFGDERSLECARRAGDLLVRTFRHGPLDLLSPRVSTHAGMAAGSVLVAIVGLHRATGEERFLEFARWIAQRLDAEGGPRIAAALRAGRGVHEIANGKAYEMLSCLCGLLDLARATGEEAHADAAKLAFEDVVRGQLLLTGGLSFEEHFRAPGTVPSVGDLSETCALVTWMQLCAGLFRLTGERRFLAPFERAAWNHLLAAQRPDGGAFCYFTPLAGPRRYRTDLNCCGSSGPRGLALVPQLVFAVRRPALVEVHLLIDAKGRLEVARGTVELSLATNWSQPSPGSYPRRAKLLATSDVPCELVVHAPTWARRTILQPLGGESGGGAARPAEGGPDAPFRLRLEPGTTRRFAIEVHELVSRFEIGGGREAGRQARLAGPLVLARADPPPAHAGEVADAEPFVPFFFAAPDDAPLRVWQEEGA